VAEFQGGPSITVSVVSHGQSAMVNRLLVDLQGCQDIVKIIITQNTPIDDLQVPASLQSRTQVIRNDLVKGFGQNHNTAFTQCDSACFCVINPDIRLREDPFPALLEELAPAPIGLVAPLIVNSSGQVEDSARKFPTPWGLGLRALKLDRGSYPAGKTNLHPDWIAGMFMLFKSEDFRKLQGFDEGFFLYCEDIDICLRLADHGLITLLTPKAQAIHDAQRSSHRKLEYLTWHLGSLWRLWRKHLWRSRSSHLRSARHS
jgi:GT2 family glycosyltransferase